MKQARVYRSFLLRLWRSNREEPSHWMASVEETGSGERHGFATLDDAMAFLEAQIEGQEQPGGGTEEAIG